MILVKLSPEEKQALLEAIREWSTTDKFQRRRVTAAMNNEPDPLEVLAAVELKICLEPDDTVYFAKLVRHMTDKP